MRFQSCGASAYDHNFDIARKAGSLAGRAFGGM